MEGTTPGQAAFDLPGWMYIGSGIIVLGLGVVNACFLTVRGQTLAKMALNIRIVDNHDESNPGFVRTVLARWFLPGVISSFCGVFWLIDHLFIFGEEKRCLHDQMATTKVIDGEARTVDPDVFAGLQSRPRFARKEVGAPPPPAR